MPCRPATARASPTSLMISSEWPKEWTSIPPSAIHAAVTRSTSTFGLTSSRTNASLARSALSHVGELTNLPPAFCNSASISFNFASSFPRSATRNRAISRSSCHGPYSAKPVESVPRWRRAVIICTSSSPMGPGFASLTPPMPHTAASSPIAYSVSHIAYCLSYIAASRDLRSAKEPERLGESIVGADEGDARHRARLERHRAQVFTLEVVDVALAAGFRQNHHFVGQRGEVVGDAVRGELDV